MPPQNPRVSCKQPWTRFPGETYQGDFFPSFIRSRELARTLCACRREAAREKEPDLNTLKALGETIKRQITLKGYATMELFAHENDIPKGTLSKILNGKVDPKATTLFRIAKGLEMDLPDLFRGGPLDSWNMEKPKSRHRAKRKKRRRR